MRVPIGDAGARVADPRDVGINGSLTIELSPEIQEHQLVRLDGARLDRRRKVVWIAGVFHGGDHRLRIGDEPFFRKPSHHQLLNVVLRRRHTISRPARDRLERPVLDPVEFFRRFDMRGDFGVVPHRRKPLDEIARRHDLDAGLANAFNRSRIDARDIGNRAAWRVFHGDSLEPRHQAPQPRFELLPARVAFGMAGKVCERMRFDGVDERAWFTDRRNQVVPTASGQVAALPANAGDVVCDRVQPAKVVQQPGVNSVVFQGRPNSCQVE